MCPTCGKGFVIPKIGRFGLFFLCSAFPRCTYKRSGTKEQRLNRGKAYHY
ncbi:topoisomerase DNA-binding C4 zinc finger domain-containing protein [Paracidovorax valerianellae]